MYVTVTAPDGIPRARMNCGNQLQLGVLIPEARQRITMTVTESER